MPAIQLIWSEVFNMVNNNIGFVLTDFFKYIYEWNENVSCADITACVVEVCMTQMLVTPK